MQETENAKHSIKAYGESQIMLKAGNFEHGVVAARPGQAYAWPGITCTEDMGVLVSASERICHHGPLGRIVIMRSRDGGRTWTLPQEVYNSEIDDRDPNLLTTPDGTIILTFPSTTDSVDWLRGGGRYIEQWDAQWLARVERQGFTKTGPVQGWLMRSEDGGRTWSAPVNTPTGQHAGASVLSDGRLVYVGLGPNLNLASPMVWESTDKGDTWEEVGEIPVPTEGTPPVSALNENHLVEISPGHLLVMFRRYASFADTSKRFLYQSHSYDEGRTWSEAQQLRLGGYPPHLTVLSSGAVLCVYGKRGAPQSIRAALSYDEGETWDHENIITVYEFPVVADIGYPVSVELSPGEILTAYYMNKNVGGDEYTQSSIEDSGGVLYTRWTLE